jgi:hypothetical protein
MVLNAKSRLSPINNSSTYIVGIIMAIGIFGPALGFGFGAVFSQMHVTLKGKMDF